MFNARINEAIDHGCNCNDGDILYSELETVVHREASSAVAIHCFGPQKTQFISGLIERTVIDITQLGCPPLTDISLPAISCTFVHCGLPIHKLSGSTFTSLLYSMQSALLNSNFFNVFQMTAWGGGYFAVTTTSTSNKQSTSPSTSMMITSNRK